MKVALVTGAMGHTGSIMVLKLIKEGWKVVATDLAGQARKDVMKKEVVFGDRFHYPSIEHPNVTFIPSDLRDKESLRALFKDEFKYDAIFHPASLYDYFAPLDILLEINVGGLKNFVEVIYEYYDKRNQKPPRFVHWSTCGVYGEPKYEHYEDGFIKIADETAAYDPPNNYSISKMEQEKYLHEMKEKKNMDWTIVRSAPRSISNVWCIPHIPMIRRMGNMFVPVIKPAKHKLMMPMIHVEDLVAAALYLYDKDVARHETYNIVCDTPSQEEYLEFICQELAVPYLTVRVRWTYYKIFAKFFLKAVTWQVNTAKKHNCRPRMDIPMAEYVTHNYYFSNAKLLATGFKFEYQDWVKGNRQTLRWYIDNGWFQSENFGDELGFEKWRKPKKGGKK